MDSNLNNTVKKAAGLNVDPPEGSASTKKPARSRQRQRSAPMDGRGAASRDSENNTALSTEPPRPEVAIRFEKRVAADLLHRQGEMLVFAALHEFKWKEVIVVGRGVADALAAVCELPAETFSVSEVLCVHGHEAQPALRVQVPLQAIATLQESAIHERLKRTLALLGDDGLTGLTTSELAARTGIDSKSIESVKRLRMSIAGRRLEGRLEILMPGADDPIVVSSVLCEPYTPTIDKIQKTYRGRLTGYDYQDRLAHFRPDHRDRRMEISFNEVLFFDAIREHSSPTRTILEVDLLEERADEVAVGYELVSMRVIQDSLKFDEPPKPT